ncbi:hypothetical protein A2U01_0067491, partial [Trifolium medium]|nr:hypothetical protein [Trifolium medium]
MWFGGQFWYQVVPAPSRSQNGTTPLARLRCCLWWLRGSGATEK